MHKISFLYFVTQLFKFLNIIFFYFVKMKLYYLYLFTIKYFTSKTRDCILKCAAKNCALVSSGTLFTKSGINIYKTNAVILTNQFVVNKHPNYRILRSNPNSVGKRCMLSVNQDWILMFWKREKELDFIPNQTYSVYPVKSRFWVWKDVCGSYSHFDI